MDIRKKIKTMKNKAKTLGMIATFGTMTLNSSAQTVQQDKQDNKIENVIKSNKYSDDIDMNIAVYNAIDDGTYEELKILLENGGAKSINVSIGVVNETPFEAAIIGMIYEEIEKKQCNDKGDEVGAIEHSKKWEIMKNKTELLINYGADLNAVSKIFSDDVKNVNPESYKFLTQVMIKQNQLNKMKQIQR